MLQQPPQRPWDCALLCWLASGFGGYFAFLLAESSGSCGQYGPVSKCCLELCSQQLEEPRGDSRPCFQEPGVFSLRVFRKERGLSPGSRRSMQRLTAKAFHPTSNSQKVLGLTKVTLTNRTFTA